MWKAFHAITQYDSGFGHGVLLLPNADGSFGLFGSHGAM